jgi:hypothetical protein
LGTGIQVYFRATEATEAKKPGWVHLIFANMSVGAKHDRSKYQITTNNLYTVMLRPLQN